MSFEPVDIHVVDRIGAPVEGVLIKIYDPTGTTFFTQATTDADGDASLLLETLDYSMRFYKFHTGFVQPQLFSVLPQPQLNVFDVKAEVFELPIATDPRLCRCSGFFRELDGAPKRNMDMHFVAEFNPALLEDAAVISNERHVRTDKTGYAQIDLIRGAKYSVTLEGVGADNPRCISVPDALSANLPDVLFPVVARVVFSPEGPFNLNVGQPFEIEVVPTVYDSAGRELKGTAIDDVKWSTGDSSIAVVLPTQSKLVLRGIAAGTTELRAERLNKSIVKIPDLPIVGQPVPVVVS